MLAGILITCFILFLFVKGDENYGVPLLEVFQIVFIGPEEIKPD